MWRDRTIRDAVWRGVDASRAGVARGASRDASGAGSLDVVSPDGSKRFVRQIFSSGARTPTMDAAPLATTISARSALAPSNARCPRLATIPGGWTQAVLISALEARPGSLAHLSVTTTHLAPHVVDGVECPLDIVRAAMPWRMRLSTPISAAVRALHCLPSSPRRHLLHHRPRTRRTPLGKTHRGHHVHLHAMPRDRS